MIIGCDIGGVVKQITRDDPMDDAIATLFRLRDAGHKIIFISKCGPSYASKTVEWMAVHGLDSFKIVFCENYAEKVVLASKFGVEAMIDDKMVVLKHFPATKYTRFWFCTEQKNIDGAQKYDPEFINTVQLVQSWADIEGALRSIE